MYVKCMTPQVAAAAFNSLNGRFFAGECSLPFMAMFRFYMLLMVTIGGVTAIYFVGK